MSFLGRKILNLRTHPKKDKKGKTEALNYESSTTFGLLYTWENTLKTEIIESFAKELSNEGKNVTNLCYNPLKEAIDCLHPTFGIDDLSSFGKIKSEVAEHFMKHQFDYLLLLDFELSEITGHICATSNASYKIGIHQKQTEDYFDLMVQINTSAGLEHYIEQLIKYIKLIKHE